MKRTKGFCVLSNVPFSNGDFGQRTECGEDPARLELVTWSGVEESQNVQGFRHDGRGVPREVLTVTHSCVTGYVPGKESCSRG